uniref:Annexin n=3 Tax=Timema TaxID=61471 RepID=A0A7R9PKP8_TIMGE|nr:unnamed protein product [Timema genevievae]
MRLNISRILQGSVPITFKITDREKIQMSEHSMRQHANKGTIHGASVLNSELSAMKLNAAFLGPIVDTGMIIRVLISHTNKQRQAIKRHYRILYGKRNLQCACVTGCLLVMKPVYCAQDLTTDVQEYLAGYLRDVTQAMLQEPLDFLSECLHGALTSVAPKVEIFVELLGGCSNIKIRQIKEYYHKKYDMELESAVRKELNKEYQSLLRILLSDKRDESEVDSSQVCSEAKMMSYAGVGTKYETDDPVIVSLLHQRSYQHLQALFNEYHRLKGRPLEDGIKAEFYRTVRDGLLVLVSAIKDLQAFLATQLEDALREPNPRHHKLIRILVSRSEIDLLDIKEKYLNMYGVKLSNAVADATSGDYRTILYRLLGN